MKYLPIMVLGGIVGLAVFFIVLFPLEPNDISQQVTGLSLSGLSVDYSQLSVTQTRTATGCPTTYIKASSGDCLKLPPNDFTRNIDRKCISLYPEGYSIAKERYYISKSIPTKGCFPINAIKIEDYNSLKSCTYRQMINKDVGVACKASGSYTDFAKLSDKIYLLGEPCPAGYQRNLLQVCAQPSGVTGFDKKWCVLGTKWAQCNITANFPAFAKPLPSTVLTSPENIKAIIENFIQQLKNTPTTTAICGAGYVNIDEKCIKSTSLPSCPNGYVRNSFGLCFPI